MIQPAIFAFFLLLLRKLLAQCSDGCLQCSSDGSSCLYCDTFNSFILENGGCIRAQYKNCTVYSVFGACLQCSPNFFVDAQSECQPVANETQIANCLINSSANTCAKCNSSFFLDSGQCQPVPKPIAGCDEYKPGFPDTCLRCGSDFLPSRDQKLCVPKPSPSTCLYYKYTRCSKCQPGFFLDKNFYLSSLLDIGSAAQKEALRVWMLGQTTGLPNECRPTGIYNCTEFANYTACKQCDPGFVLTKSGRCRTTPAEQIPHCTSYKSGGVCLECEQGFFLKDGCQPVQRIDQCLVYNTTASSSQCIRCTEDFFANGDGTCAKRTNKVGFCTTYAPKADQCAECDAARDKALTDDGLKCFDRIPFCLSYEANTQFSTNFVCKTCNNTYSFNSNSRACERGSLPNCVAYSKDFACASCQPKYLLANNRCFLQPDIANCAEYSMTTAKTCAKCQPGFFLFTRTNTCLVHDPILNCVTYASPSTCAVCKDGFYRDKGGKCTLIDAALNCRVFDGFSCTQCNSNYLLDGGKCTSAPDYVNANCDLNNAGGTTSPLQYQCFICKTGTIPVNLKGQYPCRGVGSLTNPVANCVKMSTDQNGKFTCDRCADGYWLNSGACVTSCPSGTVPHLATFSYATVNSTFNKYWVTGANVCKQPEDPMDNCALAAPTAFRSSRSSLTLASYEDYQCVKCLDGYVPVLGFNVNTQVVKIIANMIPYGRTSLTMDTPVDIYPRFDCQPKSGIVGTVNSAGLVANCDYYYYMSTLTTWGCLRCKHGFSGPITKPGSSNWGYISSCSAIPSCDATVVYKGLSYNIDQALFAKVPLQAYASCHKCTSGLPVMALAWNSNSFSENAANGVYNRIPYLIPYGLPVNSTLDSYPSSYSGDYSVQCLQITASSFTDSLTASFSTPGNCAMYILDASYPTATTNFQSVSGSKQAQLTLYCAACSPGYKVTTEYTVKSPFMIYSCTAISNCASGGTWANLCSNCATGFTYSFNTNTQQINFNECVTASSDPNCFAVATVNSVVTCQICNKGYYLNPDKVCAQIQIPFCATNGHSPLREVLFNASTLSETWSSWFFGRTLNYFFLDPPGCNLCNTGSVAVLSAEDNFVCCASIYIATGVLVADSVFPTNCAKYFVDNSRNYVCKVCQSGFVVTAAGQCLSGANIPNCKIAINQNNCDTCVDGKIFLNNQCVDGTIPNCNAYLFSRDSTTQVCQTCELGFYPSGSSCAKGAIANCVAYSSQQVCTQCADGFQVAKISGDRTYCFQLDPALKCASYSSAFLSGVMTCAACTDGYVIGQDPNIVLSHCLPFDVTANCLDYEVQPSLLGSSLFCKQCQLSFYLLTDTHACARRSPIDPQCNYLHVSQDKCLRCRPGFYIASDFQTCLPNPTGTIGCLRYKTESECLQCQQGKYLANTTCLDVPANQTLPNCKLYSTLGKCSQCADGFFLSDNVCASSLAKGCLIWGNSTACLTCPSFSGFKPEDSLLNCVNFTDANCLLRNQTFPFVCQKCAANYFPDEAGLCQPVSTPLANCLYYLKVDRCLVCQPGFALAIDGSSCDLDSLLAAQIDASCLETQVVSTPACAVCQLGYSFDANGTCAKCNVSDWPSVAFCDPYNTQRSLFCHPGYYQNASFVCLKDKLLPGSSENTTNGGNGTGNETVKFGRRMKLGLLWLLALALICG